ncbi:MAG: ABC transporter permease, partial [Calditrichaeota bacterium]|nr:ABC transporter permease [Calditrichota bacterium]MCB0312442.1 ABC transporter permease [Calditrichota bacterium]
MLSSYIKIALRNLKKYKGYSLINIAGLGIGMACCILILLYVQHELSYDRFHEKGERIYRASREWFNANGETSLHLGHVAPPIGPLLAADFPEIEEVTRLLGFSALVSQGERFYQEDNIFFAEANLFKVFTFPFLQGNPESAL